MKFDGSFPSIKIRLATENLGGVKNLGANVLDARTGYQLVTGYSSGTDDSGAFFESDLTMWHAAPVLVAVDIAHGPAEIREFTPEIGTTFNSKSGSLRLVRIIEGDQHGSASSNNDGLYRHTLRIDRSSDKAETAFVFTGSPRAHPVPIDFEFLDQHGGSLRSAGGGSTRYIKTVSVRAERSQVSKIRAIHYPHLKRVIVHLPKIPGLPEANQEIDNLFDVRIPHLRVRRQRQLRELVQQVVQMEMEPYAQEVPDDFFPRTYSNVLPGELLSDFLELRPSDESIRIDQEKHEIRLKGPLWEEWWETVRRFVRSFGDSG